MVKVSIIIPVYNAESFIDECAKSLMNQTLKDCEFIFVIDGSIDRSEVILRELQLLDSRIIIICQENRGISMARNAGIKKATGLYIGFLDNDDYLKNDMYEVLFKSAVDKNVDIVVSNTILGRDNKYIIKKPIFPPNIVYNQPFLQQEVMESLLKEEDLFAVWNKIYRRSLIIKYDIKFPLNREIEEDNMFNIQSFQNATNAIFVKYSGYYYRDVVTSESRLIIKRDYFEKSLRKYYFDYIQAFKLNISYEKLQLLKAARFVRRATYLFFKISISADRFNAKFNYIFEMSKNSELQKEIKYIKKNPYFISGYFEKVVMFVVARKSKILIFALMLVIKIIYLPAFSEILRKLNKK